MDARHTIEAWRRHCNEELPHSAFGLHRPRLCSPDGLQPCGRLRLPLGPSPSQTASPCDASKVPTGRPGLIRGEGHRLCEAGFKYENGAWCQTNAWRHDNLSNLIAGIDVPLPGFQHVRTVGETEPARHILETSRG